MTRPRFVVRCSLAPRCKDIAAHTVEFLDGSGNVVTAWHRCTVHTPKPSARVRIVNLWNDSTKTEKPSCA